MARLMHDEKEKASGTRADHTRGGTHASQSGSGHSSENQSQAKLLPPLSKFCVHKCSPRSRDQPRSARDKTGLREHTRLP